MFFNKIIDLVNKHQLHNYITPKLDFTINLYAISIFVDDEIKTTELLKAKSLITKMIKSEYPSEKEHKQEKIIEYYYNALKEELHHYMDMPNYFDMQKIKLDNQAEFISKDNLHEILEIFEADADFVIEEQQFYEKIKHYINQK